MLKFNRKTEYGVIALRYLAAQQKPGVMVSAREISDTYKIPYPILSKVLQQLHLHGMINSVQGTKGGYTLKVPLESLTLAQLVEIFEGPLGVTDCMNAHQACFLNDHCNVKGVFHNINKKIAEMLQSITLKEMKGGHRDHHNR